MNPTNFELALFGLIFVIGVMIGGMVVAFMVGRKDTSEDEEPGGFTDTDILNWLEFSECNLFFNTQVDNGSWGLLGGRNEMISVGKSIRQVVAHARMKEAEEAANAPLTEEVTA